MPSLMMCRQIGRSDPVKPIVSGLDRWPFVGSKAS
jgi:hypothetical protein